jgi:nucleoside 2-deoxyribosyltransferase
MIKKIYLAGGMENLSPDDMNGWRNIATSILSGAGVQTLNPCRRVHNFEQKTMRRIFELDMMDIRDCDMVLVNLNNDKVPKHGTAMEVFYASYILRKPVVAFKENVKYHPFFESLITEWRSTVEKACDTIVGQYL